MAVLAVALGLGNVSDSPAEAGPVDYAFPGLRGRVVADESGRPLGGVSVLVLWVGKDTLDASVNTLRVFETESGVDGAFEVPAWRVTLPDDAAPDVRGPMFFLPGRGAPTEPIRLGAAPGPIEVRLPPFAGSPEDWARRLKEVAYTLPLFWVALPRQAPPRLIMAMDRDWRRLPADVRGDLPNPRELFELVLEAYRAEAEGSRQQRWRRR
jgi:hypothetical protein